MQAKAGQRRRRRWPGMQCVRLEMVSKESMVGQHLGHYLPASPAVKMEAMAAMMT